MSKVLLTNDADLAAVADAIRAKNGTVKALVYPEDYIIGIRSISAASASGNSSISVSDAEDGDICSLTQYGVCEQDSSTNAISCNNGVLSISNGEVVATAANSETLTLGSQTATVENLYSVGSVRDEQEITTGRIIRKNAVCIYDETQNVGDRYLSSTGAKDNGAIVVYPMETEYNGQSNVTFTEDEIKDINLLEASISPIQDLHGYSHPWPGGGGKNILNPKLYTGGSYNPSVGTTWTLTESAKQFSTTDNKTFTIQTTEEWETYVIIIPITGLEHVKISYQLSSTSTLRKSHGYLDSSYKVLYNSNSSDTPVTADQQWNPVNNPNAAYIYILISNGPTASATLTLTDPQCENGTTTTSYEPYSNICPITGLTGLSVYRTGKNVAKLGSTATASALIKDLADNSVTVYNTSTGAGYKYARLSVLSAQQYAGQTLTFTAKAKVVTGTSNPRIICRLYESDYNTAIGSSIFELVGTTFSRSITLPDTIPECAVLCLNLYSDSGAGGAHEVNYYDVQLELGSDATTFEPYQGTTYSVDWSTQAGTVYGGTLDVVTGVLTVDRAMIDLGTLNWLASNPSVGQFYSETDYGAIRNSILVCSQFRQGGAYGITGDNVIEVRIGTYHRTWLRSTSFIGMSGTQVKSALTGVQLVYQLATPLTYQLTSQEVVTLVGQNNIFSSDATSIKVAVSNPVIERVAPQPFTLNSGSNTISANNLSVSSVPLKIAYNAQ